MAIKVAGQEVINDNKELVLAKLTEVDASIADTAVDVFVYDTRKDSDGGAWRKRTQHTSWYNETLNTATRGSRKEFPAVAVIVAEGAPDYDITIYDGDDPSLPMWMVFDNYNGRPTSRMIGTGDYGTPTAVVAMLNGKLCAGTSGSTSSASVWDGLFEIDFLKDHAIHRHLADTYGIWDGDISTRNSGAYPATNTYSIPRIVNSQVNDVAMTVLPNAPIDPVTQLPIPTIAVATDGGVSVIKDDGTVVDITSTDGANIIELVEFLDNNKISFYNTNHYSQSVFDIPTADVSVAGSIHAGSEYRYSGHDVLSGLRTIPASAGTGSIGNGNVSHGTDLILAGSKGVSLINRNETTPSEGMVNYITSTYNTGWMNGDIKLATLSDTDDTNVTGTELVTNGTFDTDTSGWTILGTGASFAVVSGQLVITRDGTSAVARQTITTVVGKTYVFSCDLIATTGGARIGLELGGSAGTISDDLKTYSVTHVATSTSTTVEINTYNTADGSLTVDNASVRLAEEDRSVNGNGLQVFGTVTKTPVATGADLVAYSGFSDSNYLQQPYNSDLDFGTGDFCVMGWVKVSTTATQRICGRNNASISSNRFSIYTNEGVLYFYLRDSTTTVASASINTSNVWQHFVCKRQNGVITVYVNGVGGVSKSSTQDLDADQPLYVGAENFGAGVDSPMTLGSLALFRISATAPTAEQIAKIYEDEKVLFQEGAQATLYGSSDSVKALAYDDSTELLHVGTSAGRSVFSGLRRVDNTTDAVGSAISASNGMVAED